MSQKADPIINTIKTLKKINKKNHGRCISVYNFSKVYTILPRKKLLDLLLQLIDFVFQSINKTFFEVKAKGRTSYSKKVKDCIVFTFNLLKAAVKDLTDL